MVPVLGREVEEGEQSFPVLGQAGDRLVVFGAVLVGEHIRHPDVHQSLYLLTELSPDIAADLVHKRLGEIRGEAYWVLRPVAERLTESHPVAAILLYRQMADAVLRRGQSQYYDHAVRDLITAERLVPKVEDWRGYRPQEAYRQQVAIEHRRKRAFWQRMGRAGLSWRR